MELGTEYYPTIKRRKKITSAIARVIFLSLFISEDYILAHDCTLQETQNQNSKKRTGLSGLKYLRTSQVGAPKAIAPSYGDYGPVANRGKAATISCSVMTSIEGPWQP